VNDRPGWTAEPRVLHAGTAEGQVLVLDQPLSMWGGLDPTSGLIVDRHHPQRGASVVGRLLAMPAGRGSSSSSSVLAEALRLGTGPRALLLREPDGILLVGALVAHDLYGVECPVLVLRPADHRRLRTGDTARVAGRQLRVGPLT
jgi:uncharacterized protein